MPFSDPKKNIREFGIEPGMSVADLGSGSGFYALAIARFFQGSAGKVYAVDIQKKLLSKIEVEAKEEKLSTIQTVWADLEEPGGTKLEDGSMHVTLLINILFQINDKKALINEAKRITRPDGSIILIDWSESYGGLGPQSDHVLDEDTARFLVSECGLDVERKIEAGEHHYGLVLSLRGK